MADSTPVILPSPNARGRNRVVPLPAQVFLTGTENLRITSWNSLVGAVITIQGRYFDANGDSTAFQFVHTPSANRLPTTQDFPLNTGAIANVVVYVSSGNPLPGQTFVQVSLIQGLSGATMPLGTLIQGYVTAQQVLAWPGTPLQDTLSGGGYVRSIINPAPGVGLNPTITVPTNARWELVSILSSLTTDATVGSRWPFLDLFSGSAGLAFIPAPGDQGASETLTFVWAEGMPLAALFRPGTVLGGLPARFPLLAGYQILMLGGILGPADAWQLQSIVVREWIDAQ